MRQPTKSIIHNASLFSTDSNFYSVRLTKPALVGNADEHELHYCLAYLNLGKFITMQRWTCDPFKQGTVED
jgi:hypothetical protein